MQGGSLLESEPQHVPVLLKEVMDVLSHRGGGENENKGGNAKGNTGVKSYLDATAGLGGHACAMLREHPHMKVMVLLDRDEDALAIASKRVADVAAEVGADVHVRCVHGNFKDVKTLLAPEEKFDAVLADLGVSSMQLDVAERGFRFGGALNTPLDMRMDRTQALTARDVVNTWSEMALADILHEYGEERRARHFAARLCTARGERSIETAADLLNALGLPTTWRATKGKNGKAATHPATRTFQAIRIAVNDELASIDAGVPSLMDTLAEGGRLGVISFHSLEDRRVKWIFKQGESEAAKLRKREESAASDGDDGRGRYRVSDAELALMDKGMGLDGIKSAVPLVQDVPAVRLLTKRPIVPCADEVLSNARSRSAKLRACVRVAY